MNDLDFLCERTGLSLQSLLLLLEEDYELIADSIKDDELNKAFLEISLPLFTRLSVYKIAKNSGFSLSEKAYVADSICEVYPTIHRNSHYVMDNDSSEKIGRFYLVLVGLYPEYLKNKCKRNGAPSVKFYVSTARQIFTLHNRNELAEHLPHWLDLLNQMKHKHWSL